MTEATKTAPATVVPSSDKHGRNGWRAAREEWGQSWTIGLAAFLAIGLSQGAFQSISSLYVLPLQAAFGWSRSQIAFAHTALLTVAVAAPFVGGMADRLGARRIMLIGMPASIAIYFALAAMNGSLALYYLLIAMSGVVGLTASGLTCSRVISQHFVRSRGLSLAVARSGLALASAALPSALFAVIATYGWRAGYVAQGILVLVIALPAVYLWIREPASPTLVGKRDDSQAEHGWLYLLHDRRVWFLCLGAGLGYAPATALMSQLQPLLISKGVEANLAAALVGMAGIASLVGAVITGSLVDRFWAPGVAFVFACGSAAGSVLLASHTTVDGPVAGAAILMVGLGLGAEIDVVAYMVARYFGVRTFSTIYGMAVFFIAVANAIGASLLGASFDHFGNYDKALLVIAGSFTLAGCVYLLMGRYPRQAE